VLALHPCDRLLHVGENRALEEVARPAFLDEPAEDRLVEGLGDGLPFFLRVRQALQGFEEFRPGVDNLDRHLHGGEGLLNLAGFVFPHDAVVDEVGLQTISQGPVAQERHHGRVHASRQGVDGGAVSHRGVDGPDLFGDEASGVQFRQADFLDAHERSSSFMDKCRHGALGVGPRAKGQGLRPNV
jgi:hypothetical protein